MSWFQGKKIVVPYDFSDEAGQAIDVALEISTAAEVHVVHVAAVLAAAEPGVVWNVAPDIDRQEHIQQEFNKSFSEAKYERLKFAVRFGDPGQEIADFSQSEGAGLIVMPSHGRTGLNRMLIGSVAERVVRLAHCPVLVLRK